MAYSSKDKLLELAMQNQSSQNNALLNRGGGRFNNLLGIISSVASQTANPNTEMGSILGTAGRTYIGNLQNMNENNFLRDVQTIHFSQSDPQTKLQALMGTLAKYGQDPKNYSDVLEMYSKQIEATQNQMMNPLQQAQTQYYQARANQQPALSPSLQKAKDDRVAALIQMSEENPMKLQQLSDAEAFLKTPGLIQGRLGAINIKRLQETDPSNPILGQWQNLKSILTNAQLDYVGKTKGAVSDREMALFGQAVANDDLVSVARMLPQIRKIKNGIISSQRSATKTFQRLYGEDPSSFAKFDEPSGSDLSSMSDDELKKLAGLS